MTPTQMSDHIAALCLAHGITIEFRRTGGRAWRRARCVSIAPVKSAITYAVALHEVGHICGRSPSRRLDREAAAWEWARANAREWTPAMQAKMKDSLDSYARWFVRKWRRGVPVAPSASFDLLARRGADDESATSIGIRKILKKEQNAFTARLTSGRGHERTDDENACSFVAN